MCLPEQSIEPVPEETAQIAAKSFQREIHTCKYGTCWAQFILTMFLQTYIPKLDNQQFVRGV